MTGTPDLPHINHLFSTTTPIKFEDEQGYATGFFYNGSKRTYLITNRHVLFDPDENHQPSSIRIYLRDIDDLCNWKPIDISLINDEGEPCWLEHTNNDSENCNVIDVAAVPLERRLDSTEAAGNAPATGNLAFTTRDLLWDHLKITGGEHVAVVGYPVLDQSRNYFPVIRQGLLSTPYWSGYPEDPSFWIDSWMLQGTSGSAIVTNPMGWYKTTGNKIKNPKTFLLGIHSHDIQEPQGIETDYRTTGLNIGWNANLIEDIIHEE